MRGQWRNNLFPGVGRDDSARRLGGLYCFAGVFRRLRAASSFASGGKGTKTPPGDGSGWTLRVHIRLSPDPITGDALLFDVAEFPARKNGVASALPSGPLGPGFAKIAAGAVQKLRLGFPNQRSRCWIRRRGGYQPPASLPPPRGPTPLIKGRCRAATEGIGTGAPEGGG